MSGAEEACGMSFTKKPERRGIFPGEGLELTESLHDPLPRAQCAGAVLMIRPASFDYNPETALTNSMMQRPGVPGATAHNDLARVEFQHMVNAVRGEGITVCVADDTPQPPHEEAADERANEIARENLE